MENHETPERRLEQYRQHHRRKITSMTPEELAAFKAEKAAYDREYRVRNAEKRKAQREAYKARHNEIRREKYRFTKASPLVLKTEEEKKQRRKAYSQQYLIDHPDKQKEYYRQNRSAILTQKHGYYLKNKKTIIKRQNALVASDPRKRAIRNLYVRTSRFMKEGKGKKDQSTMTMLGCDRTTLRQWIEGQFTEGMNWENYGHGGWHIDHKHPISKFDHSDPEQVAKCWHYTNLQPMWAIDNIRKSNKI